MKGRAGEECRQSKQGGGLHRTSSTRTTLNISYETYTHAPHLLSQWENTAVHEVFQSLYDIQTLAARGGWAAKSRIYGTYIKFNRQVCTKQLRLSHTGFHTSENSHYYTDLQPKLSMRSLFPKFRARPEILRSTLVSQSQVLCVSRPPT